MNILENQWKRNKVKWILLMLLVAGNLAVWVSTPFSDWYIANVFPIWVNTYGRLTGLFPFSVGEWMIGIGLLLVAVALVLTVVLLVDVIIEKTGKNHIGWRGRLRPFIFSFYKAFVWILLGVCTIMTLNCTMIYHGSTFSEKYFGVDKNEYTLEDLIQVRNLVVERCNELSAQLERDKDGNILYKGKSDAEWKADESIGDIMGQTAREAMQKLGESYGNLKGYYPTPKPLLSSDLMSQMYMQGYYFPFSMEANYNDVMYLTNRPATFCHEMAHLKGYIYEDEANFIAYLACIGSEDLFFQYSGYLSVLYYLDNDFYDGVGRDRDLYLSQVNILPQVHADNVFLTDEEWDRINGKAVIGTETVDLVSDTLTNASLTLNGVKDGIQSYNRVVKLLLQYYSR